MIPKPTRQVAIVLTIAITSPISAETAKKLAHHKKIATPEKASVHSGWLAYVISQLCWAINWITNRLRSTGLIATEIWFGWPKWEVNPPMFLRMEFFYREMRRRSGVLMERAKPEGGQWNYDAENRKSFGKSGPGLLLATPRKFEPDSITRDVLSLVARTFPDNPGSLEHFDFPVTATEAQLALDDFVEHRLPVFGDYQDAMWADEPYLFHSRISAMMNLKLLYPRRVLMAVEDAYHREQAPLCPR